MNQSDQEFGDNKMYVPKSLILRSIILLFLRKMKKVIKKRRICFVDSEIVRTFAPHLRNKAHKKLRK